MKPPVVGRQLAGHLGATVDEANSVMISAAVGTDDVGDPSHEAALGARLALALGGWLTW